MPRPTNFHITIVSSLCFHLDQSENPDPCKHVLLTEKSTLIHAYQYSDLKHTSLPKTCRLIKSRTNRVVFKVDDKSALTFITGSQLHIAFSPALNERQIFQKSTSKIISKNWYDEPIF